MSLLFSTLGIVLLGINSITFFVMLFDKVRSRKTGASRISEGVMFFMATLFGSVGVFVGMFVFRHKSRKWYFLVGIPLLLLQNCASIYVLHTLFLK